MSSEIKFTQQVQRITATTTQPLTQALRVGGAKQLDLLLSCPGLTGTSPTLLVGIYTSMQNDNEDAWALIGTFTQVTSANKYYALTVTGVLKYVRYYAELGGTGSPTATFDISGYARDA